MVGHTNKPLMWAFLPFPDSSDSDIAPLMIMINPGENMKMKKLIASEKVESHPLKLQREDLDLASARILVDALPLTRTKFVQKITQLVICHLLIKF